MLTSVADVLHVASLLFEPEQMPQRLRFLTIPTQFAAGRTEREIATELRTTAKRVRQIRDAADPIAAALEATLEDAEDPLRMLKVRQGLGQMLLGTLAERAFEDLYKRKMATTELRLEDTREGGTDTDYRVYNGAGKPVFRINIKFHGSPFRKAKETVGLDPEDCFALATYKIRQATLKQKEEFLPYIFVIIGVPGLKGETVGAAVPSALAHFASLILASKVPGKRGVEDRIVRHLVDDPQPLEVAETIQRYMREVEGAPWRVLSARRADILLHEHLFERVFALSVRGFAMNWRGAEVDMHFSISNELTSLDEFLQLLKDHGLHGLATRLDRGAI